MNRQERLTREEDALALKASVDVALSEAAARGVRLVCYGLLVHDKGTGQLCWFNRSHPDFVTAVRGLPWKAEQLALMGVMEGRGVYLHVLYDKQDEESSAEARAFAEVFSQIPPPGKDTLHFMRLSRKETGKVVAEGRADDNLLTVLLTAYSALPADIDIFYLYDIAGKWRLLWPDGPNIIALNE